MKKTIDNIVQVVRMNFNKNSTPKSNLHIKNNVFIPPETQQRSQNTQSLFVAKVWFLHSYIILISGLPRFAFQCQEYSFSHTSLTRSLASVAFFCPCFLSSFLCSIKGLMLTRHIMLGMQCCSLRYWNFSDDWLLILICKLAISKFRSGMKVLQCLHTDTTRMSEMVNFLHGTWHFK